MTTILKKMMSVLLTILFALFPMSTLPLQQQLKYGSVEFCEKVTAIVQSKNVESLKGCMCKNIKDNYPNLSDDIQNLYNCIEGEIVDIYYINEGGYWSMQDNDGHSFAQGGFKIYISTTVCKYEVGMIREYTNTRNPDECGIRSMVLLKVLNFNELDSRYKLASIVATNGIEEWHE